MFLLAQGHAAQSAEVKVLSVLPLKTFLDELGPQFERATGHKLTIKYDVSAALKRQIDAGETFDVACILPAIIDDLLKQGKVAAGTRTDISRAAVGVAVKKGAPKPDIGSAEAFKRTLLNAKSIAYSGEGGSGIYFKGVLERLGIAAEMNPKLKPLASSAVVPSVAKGEVELAVISPPLSLQSLVWNWSASCRRSCSNTSSTRRVLAPLPRRLTQPRPCSSTSRRQPPCR